MNQNPTRQPAGIPTGGQFAASARNEADVALHAPVDPMGSCPDCGAPMPGRVGTETRDGRDLDVYLPGSRCTACSHEVAEMVFESDPDEEGYFYETRLEPDGTLTCDGFSEDGDHTSRLWSYEPDHPLYDDEAKVFRTTGAAVTAGLIARDGEQPPEKPFVLTSQDRVTLSPPSDLRVGDTVLLDNGVEWVPVTVTSLDGDHKSTSVEFDGDEETIASYGDDEPFLKVERGAMAYVAQRELNVNSVVADTLFRDALLKAKPGDVVRDPDGDAFVLGGSTAIRYYDGCSTCAEAQAKNSEYFPAHKASPRCASGGRSHCTCDTCW